MVVVESDKADMDVESFYDGFLAHICVEDGEMATVGAPIAYVAETEAEIPEAQAKAAAASAARRRRRPLRRRKRRRLPLLLLLRPLRHRRRLRRHQHRRQL